MTNNTKFLKVVELKSHIFTSRNTNDTDSGKRDQQYLIKLKIHTSYDPGILLLCIFPRETKVYFHTKSCMQMLASGVFIILNNLIQTKYTSVR